VRSKCWEKWPHQPFRLKVISGLKPFGGVATGLQHLSAGSRPQPGIELRYSAVDFARMHANAQELVGLAPNAIVTGSAPTTRALQARTKTIPIVFLSVGDPVANGFVTSISHHGYSHGSLALSELRPM
jgi:ABC-type uncharacterized transport system substrate-binding protein